MKLKINNKKKYRRWVAISYADVRNWRVMSYKWWYNIPLK